MKCADNCRDYCINDIEMIGKKFGQLEVIEFSHANQFRYYKCKCDCGALRIVSGTNLRLGKILRCHPCKTKLQIKHGMSGKNPHIQIYNTWQRMKNNCFNPNAGSYHLYGALGITICDRWFKFENFYEDMGIQPKDTKLERKNKNDGFFKKNCFWKETPRSWHINEDRNQD